MSALTWIALILMVYLVVIKPMFKGLVERGGAKNNNQQNKPHTSTKNRNPKEERDDYVDYEEIK